MEHHGLETLLIFLAAGIAGVGLAKRLRLSPIIGFFVMGALCGEHGFDLVEASGALDLMTELGVAFLLFDVGTHTSLRKLWQARHDLLGFGLAQVGATTLVVTGVCMLLGQDLLAALVIGAGVSLSSTAVVLQVLKDRGESGSPLAGSAVSLLVFQDVFVVLLLVALPSFAAGGGGEGAAADAADGAGSIALALGLAVLEIALAFAAVMLIGRFLLQPVFRWITTTQSDEMFTFAALFFVLSTAWAVSLVGLSLPLGAFLAGLLISESRFAPLVQAETAPFRGLLLSLFFLRVGMTLSIDLFVARPLPVVALTAGIVAVKAALLFTVARVMRRSRGFALRFGLILAQGSEFTFVLFALAGSARLGLLSDAARDLLVVCVGVTMAITPALAALGARLGSRLEPVAPEAEAPDRAGVRGKVVLIGFEEVARELAHILVAGEIPYVALTSDRDRVASGRCAGFEVELGSPERPRGLALLSVGIARAHVLVADAPELVRSIVQRLQAMDRDYPIYVATRDLALFEELQTRGLRDVLVKNENTATEIGRQILAQCGREPAAVEAILAAARAKEEELIAGIP